MSNEQQIEYWNTEAGENWVTQAAALDLMLQAIGLAVLANAALQLGDRVVDIGCGSGALSFAAQERVGTSASVTGLDISRPLLRNAQRRALEKQLPTRFVEGDAATWHSDAQADAVISRFGVMFFDNPIVAFANILQFTKPGGKLTFACWRNPKENDLGGGLMQAAAQLFTPPEVKPEPKAPGPYAFADQDYVRSLLTTAGWRDIKFAAWDGFLPMAGATAHENAEFLARLGPIGRAMREQNVAIEKVIAVLLPFLEQRKDNSRYALKGAVWLVSAHR
jgi:ubiquinone/menaquinone biosynthesis C-methylase UbiE